MKRSTRPQAAELLEANVKRILDSNEYKAALKFRRNFHRYSFKNVWLIYCQMDTATQVAGFRVWQSLGRQVKKGEKGLRIFAPLAVRNDDGEKELRGFKTATVFDLSQTEGDPVPELPTPQPLTQNDERIPGFLLALERFAKGNGNALEYTDLKGTCNGFFKPSTGEIKVSNDLTPLDTLRVLVHEIAHSLAHAAPKRDKSRSTVELEAESAAFLVCDALGLDTSASSFVYLARWTDTPEQILPAANFAAKLSDNILEALNEPLAIPTTPGVDVSAVSA